MTHENKVVPVDSDQMQATNNNHNDAHGSLSAQALNASKSKESLQESAAEKERRGSVASVESLVHNKKSFKDEFMEFYNQCTYENAKIGMKWFLESAKLDLTFGFDDAMMLGTIFVLYADEIRIIAAGKEHDFGFEVMNSICFFGFVFEVIFGTWSKSNIKSFQPFVYTGYLFSFYFWLDIIAILSMVPDINWMARGIGIDGISNAVAGGGGIMKAGRVVRMVRLVRLVRLYKIAEAKRKADKIERELMRLVKEGTIPYSQIENRRQLYKERGSKLGSQLSETTTKRVIILVLVLLCVVPLLQYAADDRQAEVGVEILHHYHLFGSEKVKAAAVEEFTQSLARQSRETFLLRLQMLPYSTNPNGYIVDHAEHLNSLRDNSIYVIEELQSSSGVRTKAWFSVDPLAKENSLFQILLTIFISIILVGGSVIFNSDVQRMVLAPIERMMNMVEAVSKDPLRPIEFQHQGNASGGSDYETRLLETTIEKITGLLRVGFGEAGAGIISANLTVDAKGASEAMNVMLPGIRVYALVGFCDIHRFDDVNQVMGKDVLLFVNTIAEIVHSSVHEWGGQTNKNLGNAFVILWRIGDEDSLWAITSGSARNKPTFELPEDNPMPNDDSPISGLRKSVAAGGASHRPGSAVGKSGKQKKAQVLDLRRVPGIEDLADKALIGYLKVIAEINRNRAVLAYREEPRLTKNGTEEFKVRMGFGLHAGWAIEGAVGSLQKVDATYLSPHVNMAARLETSSRQYGVPLLMSQSFYDLMSPDAQDYCRRLDVVTVKGSEFPIGIYTYDCYMEQKFNDQRAPRNSTESNALFDEDDKGPVFMPGDADAADVFEEDSDMIQLRSHMTDEFLAEFKRGVDTYLEGSWPEARVYLENASKMMSEVPSFSAGDGPCLTLLEYMQERDWRAPSSWAGYRPLTSK